MWNLLNMRAVLLTLAASSVVAIRPRQLLRGVEEFDGDLKDGLLPALLLERELQSSLTPRPNPSPITTVPVAAPTRFPTVPVAAPTAVPIIPTASPAEPTRLPGTLSPSTAPVALPTTAPVPVVKTTPPSLAPAPQPTNPQPTVPTPTAPTPTAPSPNPPTPALLSIFQLLSSDTDFALYTEAIVSGNLRQIYNLVNPLTVFAPTDTAMASLGLDYVRTLIDVNEYSLHLRYLVNNHATNVSYGISDLVQGLQMLMLTTETTNVANNASGIFLFPSAAQNGLMPPVQPVEVDIPASNGVIHPLGTTPLTPIWYFFNIITVLQNVPSQFSTLLSYINQAGLTEVVASLENVTLAAPTNAAFAALPPNVTDLLNADIEALTYVLQYHILKLVFNPLATGTGTFQEASVAGPLVTCVVTSRDGNIAEITFNDAMAEMIYLTKYNIVYQINKVLLPPDIVIPTPTPNSAPFSAPVQAPIVSPMQAPVPSPTMEAPVATPVAPPTPIQAPVARPVQAPAASPSSPSGTNIVNLIQSRTELSTYASALALSGLSTNFGNASQQTVFAATNGAFLALNDEEYINLLLNDTAFLLHLRNFVSMHRTLDGSYPGAALTNGLQFGLANGEVCEVARISSGVQLRTISARLNYTSNVDVNIIDATASNGMLQEVDYPMLPLFYSYNAITILDLLADQFSTFRSLVFRAGLEDLLRSERITTLLPPTNAAFEALNPATLAYLQDVANQEVLVKVIQYHFLKVLVSFAVQPIGESALPTYEGSTVTLNLTRGSDGFAIFRFNGFLAGAIYLYKWGATYTLNGVLVPPDVVIPSS